MDLWEVLKASKGVPITSDMYDALFGKALGGAGSVWETESVPYLFRQSGGALNSRLLGKEKDTIVGASVAWNQLVNSGDTSVTVTSGHKYYSNINNVKTIGSSSGTAISINDSTKDNVIDLTLLLGSTIADYIYTLESGTAGAGVAKLKEWGFFSEPYYAYNQGEIKSVSGLSAHKMVGKNQINPTGYAETFIDVNGITTTNNGDGTFTVKGTATANAYITVCDYRYLSDYGFFKAGETYTLSGRYSADVYVGFGVYGSGTDYWANSESGATMSFTDEQITSKRYRLIIVVRSGTALGDEGIVIKPQIELGSTATDYKPYRSDTYALDSSKTLRGLFKMDADHNLYADGDTYESSGAVMRKYGVVDLGSLDWTYDSAQRFYSQTALSDAKGGNYENAISTRFVPSITPLTNQSVDRAVAIYTNKVIYIVDRAYTDATAFKTAMNGVYLVYELATPTTETADPFTNPQTVDKDGTEEYVTTQNFVPIGHETQYKCSPTP